jgi:hypothetical protein
MLRKTSVALLLCVLLCVWVVTAIAQDNNYAITVSEAPSTYDVISPTSTRWIVKRGRLVPISALRAKYFRVSTYHTAPFPMNTVDYVQTATVIHAPPAQLAPYPQSYAPPQQSGGAPMYAPAPGANAPPEYPGPMSDRYYPPSVRSE